MKNRKYDYLLFDADNTLYDFSLAEYNAFGEVARACGLDFTDALYRRYSEINDAQWKLLEKKETTLDRLKTERFRLLLHECGFTGEDADDLAEKMAGDYLAALSHQKCLIDGAVEVCHKLKEHYRLYLVTNGTSAIQRARFTDTPVSDCFEDMFISEELGVSKPAREYFDKVLAAIGESDRRKYLVIGDSLTSDCDGAIAAGLDICRYDPDNKSDGGRKLTYNINRLTDLCDLLGVNDD